MYERKEILRINTFIYLHYDYDRERCVKPLTENANLLQFRISKSIISIGIAGLIPA
jgi:hypothetical protein